MDMCFGQVDADLVKDRRVSRQATFGSTGNKMVQAHDLRTANIALLIDADNASPDHLDSVLTVLAELGTVNVRRVYGNWSKTSLKG